VPRGANNPFTQSPFGGGTFATSRASATWREKIIASLFAVTLSLTVVSAQSPQITIDAAASLGEISPSVHGQFIEYMGKCIYRGIYEEGSLFSITIISALLATFAPSQAAAQTTAQTPAQPTAQLAEA
jgi:hypothetical protein